MFKMDVLVNRLTAIHSMKLQNRAKIQLRTRTTNFVMMNRKIRWFGVWRSVRVMIVTLHAPKHLKNSLTDVRVHRNVLVRYFSNRYFFRIYIKPCFQLIVPARAITVTLSKILKQAFWSYIQATVLHMISMFWIVMEVSLIFFWLIFCLYYYFHRIISNNFRPPSAWRI